MKTLNLIKSAAFILVLSFLTIQASPINKGHDKKFTTYSFSTSTESIDAPHMICSSDGLHLFISYSNPLGEELTFTVSDLNDNVLKAYTVTDISGMIVVSNQELVALGGTGTYIVSMYSDHPKKKIETSTVVIIIE